MEDPMDAQASSEPISLDSIRSEMSELTDTLRSCNDEYQLYPSDYENLLKDCALHLEGKIEQIISECSDVGFLADEDLDACLEHLKEELKTIEAEKTTISNEIENLMITCTQDSNKLESDLEGLKYSLDFVALQDLEKANAGAGQLNLITACDDHEFKIWKLNHQIEKNKITLKTLQDLDCVFKRFEATEKVEDAFNGLKVIEFEGNSIRLSLRTYIPNLKGLACQQHIEGIIEPSEVNHELLIEVMNEILELKKFEIFPNDVYIGDIIDAAKSFRFSLNWVIRKVQDRITICTLRRFVVKAANKSRHSFEYLDRDEMVVAHMVERVDAFIKVPQGWPVAKSALKLISLKSSENCLKKISSKFLCGVEEEANSLDVSMRHNISNFVDAIENILDKGIHVELCSDDVPGR